MGKEKIFEQKVKNYIAWNNGWCVKYFANGFTKSGIPDILACVSGVFLGIEVKAENGKPSELQLYTVREIRKAGGIGMILYPDDFETFKELITDLTDEETSKEDVILLYNRYFEKRDV